jgi:hypothetical protein
MRVGELALCFAAIVPAIMVTELVFSMRSNQPLYSATILQLWFWMVVIYFATKYLDRLIK